MPRILVVDDENIFRETLSVMLEQSGYRVSTAKDGEEALAMLDRITPDLILLDVHMPHLDGIAFLRQLRSHPKRKNVPVILLTCIEDLDRVLRMEDIGIKEYILKSAFSLEDVLSKISRHVRPNPSFESK
jgi:CheY-like chemotaxis protein